MKQTDFSTDQNKGKSIININTYINIFYLHSVTSGESQADNSLGYYQSQNV